MEALFLKVLDISLSAGWLVIAVVLLRLVLKKAPRWTICCLWALVTVRLLCPFSFESRFSLIPKADPLAAAVSYLSEAASVPPDAAAVNPEPGEISYNYSASAEPSRTEADQEISLTIPSAGSDRKITGSAEPSCLVSVGCVIWILGIILMLFNALQSFHRLHRKVAPSVAVGDNVLICDYIDTPFILGVFQPKIYLPSSLPPDQATCVLSHEQAHLHRRDHMWKPLSYILLSIYWFHPLLWLGYILQCRDIELACDERVIRDMDSGTKRAYAEALLACSAPRSMIAACPLAFGEVDVKHRIKSVLHYKKPGFWILLLAFVLCILLAVCFLTDPYTTTLSQLSGVDRQEIDSVFISSLNGRAVLAVGQELTPLWQLLENAVCDPEPYLEKPYTELDKFDFAALQCLKFLRGNQELGLLYFTSDFSTVCTLDDSGILHYHHAYRTNSMGEFFDSATRLLSNQDDTLQPFASADDPHSWTSGVSPDAVGITKQYIYQHGMYTVTGITQMRFQALTEVLNALPPDAFGPPEAFTELLPVFDGIATELPNVAVTIADQANGFSVSLRYHQEADGQEIVDLIIVDSLRLMEEGRITSSHSCLKWIIRDNALTAYMRGLYEHPSLAAQRLANHLIWEETPVTVRSGSISIRLAQTPGWEYETVEDAESFGIRCRPRDAEEGWLYFSFWADGYSPEEEDRYYQIRSSTGSDVKDWVTSLRSSAGLRFSNDPWSSVWSYQKWCTTEGAFAIINTLSKEDFLKYEEEIEAHEHYTQFLGGHPISADIVSP